mmetsp:Transcript_65243/g.181379  ORF Transcript_65243/g.181379 Transcript_65243/m.181379 type:complete len:202 (+) Transcript_65243:2294-2899(+)
MSSCPVPTAPKARADNCDCEELAPSPRAGSAATSRKIQVRMRPRGGDMALRRPQRQLTAWTRPASRRSTRRRRGVGLSCRAGVRRSFLRTASSLKGLSRRRSRGQPSLKATPLSRSWPVRHVLTAPAPPRSSRQCRQEDTARSSTRCCHLKRARQEVPPCPASRPWPQNLVAVAVAPALRLASAAPTVAPPLRPCTTSTVR